jgi:hypothetical protein
MLAQLLELASQAEGEVPIGSERPLEEPVGVDSFANQNLAPGDDLGQSPAFVRVEHEAFENWF